MWAIDERSLLPLRALSIKISTPSRRVRPAYIPTRAVALRLSLLQGQRRRQIGLACIDRPVPHEGRKRRLR